MKLMRLKSNSVVIPIMYMLFIFFLSSIPADNNKLGVITLTPSIQNVLHIPLFGILAFFVDEDFYS